MLMLRHALATLALTAALPATGVAGLLEFEIHATAIEPVFELPPRERGFPGVEPGAALVGRFSFETGLEDSEPDPSLGVYFQAPPARVELTFAGLTLTGDVDPYTVTVADDVARPEQNPVDRFSWRVRDTPLAEALAEPGVLAIFSLSTSDTSVLSGDGLPTGLSLSDFETHTLSILIVQPGEFELVEASSGFRIDSLRLVPEPSAAILVGMALLALAYVNR